MLIFWYGFKQEIINGSEINKTINEITKYFICTPSNQRTINTLKSIKIDVPRAGWDKTKLIRTMIIYKETIIVVKEFTFSIFNLL